MNLQRKEDRRRRDTLGARLGTALGMAALSFVLPALCFLGGAEEPETLPPVPTAAQDGREDGQPAPADTGTGELDAARTVRVLGEDGTAAALDLGEYLWGVVAAEMPASFEEEALKAQAVAARSYTLWKMEHGTGAHPDADLCTDHTCCQAWISREEAAANWGENAAAYADKITRAVTLTDGMVLCWEGQPIQAVFHSSSAGRTEDAVAVWGSTVPYLVGVDTPEGEEVPNYHTAVTLTAEQVSAALAGLGCDLTGDPSGWFQSFAYTDSGAVASAQVGGKTVSGADLRAALGLRSANFQVGCAGGTFTFSVTGYGHGVGMSQYGANALAREGKTWRDIVSWYYTGVTVERYAG